MRGISFLSPTVSVVLAQIAQAADPTVFFFTKFPTSTAALRDELIERMDNISHWSCTNEPDVSKYALVVPAEDDGTTIAYSIEQYADDATFDNHLAADMVATTLFAWSTSIPDLFAGDVIVQNFTLFDDAEKLTFAKPGFADVADPYIVVEEFTYETGKAADAMGLWEVVATAASYEEGTLIFGVYGDPENADKLWTLGAYESAEYLAETHAPSPAIANLVEGTKDYLVESSATALSKKGGFLYKGPDSCA